MANSGIRTNHLRLPNRGDDTDTCIIQATNESAICARIRLRVMGKIRKRKKTPTTELNIFLSKKNFQWKITANKNMAVHHKMGWEQYHI